LGYGGVEGGMKKRMLIGSATLALVILSCCFVGLFDTETPTTTPIPTFALTDTPVPTDTPILTETLTPIVSPTDTSSPQPTKVAPSMWRCPDSTEGAAYVASENSNKFHKLTCKYVKQIKGQNRICFGHREAAIAFDYVPCKICNP